MKKKLILAVTLAAISSQSFAMEEYAMALEGGKGLAGFTAQAAADALKKIDSSVFNDAIKALSEAGIPAESAVVIAGALAAAGVKAWNYFFTGTDAEGQLNSNDVAKVKSVVDKVVSEAQATVAHIKSAEEARFEALDAKGYASLGRAEQQEYMNLKQHLGK